MAQEKQQKVKKAIKKSFYEVTAPLVSTKIQLYAASPEELHNKTVLIDLTKSLRGKSLELKLRIKNNSGSLQGIPESLNLAGSYIQKIMRAGVDYAEDSFSAECRDGFVKIKPFLLTRKRVPRSVLRALRNEARSFLDIYIKTRASQELMSEIISNKLQKQLSLKLKKVYPLALCEIRFFEIEKYKNPANASDSA